MYDPCHTSEYLFFHENGTQNCQVWRLVHVQQFLHILGTILWNFWIFNTLLPNGNFLGNPNWILFCRIWGACRVCRFSKSRIVCKAIDSYMNFRNKWWLTLPIKCVRITKSGDESHFVVCPPTQKGQIQRCTIWSYVPPRSFLFFSQLVKSMTSVQFIYISNLDILEILNI